MRVCEICYCRKYQSRLKLKSGKNSLLRWMPKLKSASGFCPPQHSPKRNSLVLCLCVERGRAGCDLQSKQPFVGNMFTVVEKRLKASRANILTLWEETHSDSACNGSALFVSAVGPGIDWNTRDATCVSQDLSDSWSESFFSVRRLRVYALQMARVLLCGVDASKSISHSKRRLKSTSASRKKTRSRAMRILPKTMPPLLKKTKPPATP